MFSKIILSFVLVNIISAKTASLCKVNEIFDTCGTACELTCQNKDQVILCPEICVQGCFCQEGYVRSNEDRTCVPQDSCAGPVQCGENEEYSDCATLCPLTCDGSSPQLCPEVCKLGCVCQEGFIRSTIDGSCVPEDTCSVN